MTKYVALLRGINVGGNNQIRMPALKAAFEEAGYQDVSTYIQSGNVLFSASAKSVAALEKKVEKVIDDAFGLPIVVLIRSHDEMADVIARAPKGFGTKPDEFRYDVWFLKHPLTSKEAEPQLPAFAEGIDEVYAGPGVFYTSRVTALATKSRQTKIVGTPLYKQISIRNWNTTTKLLALLDA